MTDLKVGANTSVVAVLVVGQRCGRVRGVNDAPVQRVCSHYTSIAALFPNQVHLFHSLDLYYFLFSLDVNESICSLHLSKSAHVVVTAAINYVVACHALACDRYPAEHAAWRGSGPEVCIPTECGFFPIFLFFFLPSLFTL